MNKAECQNETRKHIFNTQKLLNKVIVELISRAQNHDQTKLESPEVEIFMQHTSQLHGTTYGSKEYKDILEKMKPAVDHHYKSARHHPEHFGEHAGLSKMNLIDIIEMLCDWQAASLRHKNGSIADSIEKNQQRFGYSDEMKSVLVNTVEYLKMKG
ncbi:MAG: DUF5662 family protein [Nanoarchaeota archaeon]